jgi:concentrative nucleoside transporter, CNT family
MQHLRGLLGLVFLLAIAFAVSKNRKGIAWRTVVGALVLQAGFAALVLRWGPGRDALSWVSDRVTTLIGYTNEGTAFVFGPLTAAGSKNQTIFALQVLPVIVFLGALIGLLFYLRVIQFATYVIGGAISWALRVTKIESLFAATVIFLGQSEAPLMIAPYLRGLTTAQMFTVMTSGFAAASGSTLVGYSLLGAPLKYLLAATVMNAPAGLLMAKLVWPDSTEEKAARADEPDASGRPDDPEDVAAPSTAAGRGGRSGATATVTSAGDVDVRTVRDEESANAIDALGRGALAGGRIAVTVGALLIAFVALIALANGILSGVGGWFGVDDLTFQRLVGWAFAPLAWLLGVPWRRPSSTSSWRTRRSVRTSTSSPA